MKNKGLFLLIMLLLIFSGINAQENTTNKNNLLKFEHSLGAAAGFSTGYGLSYRVYKNKLGVQFVFAPFKNENITRHSLGVTFLYKLDERKSLNFFAYQGNHYYYKRNHYSDDNFYYEPDETKSDFIHSLGLGFEFKILDPINVSFMAGFASYHMFELYNVTAEMSIFYTLK